MISKGLPACCHAKVNGYRVSVHPEPLKRLPPILGAVNASMVGCAASIRIPRLHQQRREMCSRWVYCTTRKHYITSRETKCPRETFRTSAMASNHYLPYGFPSEISSINELIMRSCPVLSSMIRTPLPLNPVFSKLLPLIGSSGLSEVVGES